MGRRKIEIQPLTNERNRAVTFVKRKNGLFKKAYELGVLCSVDVAVIIFEKRHGDDQVRLHQYASSDIHLIVQRQLGHTGQRHTRGPTDFLGGDDDDDTVPPLPGVKRKTDSPDPRLSPFSPIPIPNTQLDHDFPDSLSPHPSKRPRPTIPGPAIKPSSTPTPSSSTPRGPSGSFRLATSHTPLPPAEHGTPTGYTFAQPQSSINSRAQTRSIPLHPRHAQTPTPASGTFTVPYNPSTGINTHSGSGSKSTSSSTSGVRPGSPPTRSLSRGGGGSSLAFEWPVRQRPGLQRVPQSESFSSSSDSRPASSLISPPSSSSTVRGMAGRPNAACVDNNEWFDLLCGRPPSR